MFIADSILVLSLLLFCAVTWAWLRARSRPGPRRSPASRLALLRRAPLLAGLSDEQLLEISAVVRELSVPKDSFVIRENRAGEAMYVLLHGKMHILKRDGREQTLVQVVEAGELIGEMAVMTGARRIASARTVTPCDLLQIDRDDFQELLAHKPGVEAAVWDVCERHSIDLAMRDHDLLEKLGPASRQEWIGLRRSDLSLEGATLTCDEAGYLAVISGSLEKDGINFDAPCLIHVDARDRFQVRVGGRLARLPLPWRGDQLELKSAAALPAHVADEPAREKLRAAS